MPDGEVYTISLPTPDLLGFLELNRSKYGSFTLRMEDDSGNLPRIELSREMSQDLIVYSQSLQF